MKNILPSMSRRRQQRQLTPPPGAESESPLDRSTSLHSRRSQNSGRIRAYTKYDYPADPQGDTGHGTQGSSVSPIPAEITIKLDEADGAALGCAGSSPWLLRKAPAPPGVRAEVPPGTARSACSSIGDHDVHDQEGQAEQEAASSSSEAKHEKNKKKADANENNDNNNQPNDELDNKFTTIVQGTTGTVNGAEIESSRRSHTRAAQSKTPVSSSSAPPSYGAGAGIEIEIGSSRRSHDQSKTPESSSSAPPSYEECIQLGLFQNDDECHTKPPATAQRPAEAGTTTTTINTTRSDGPATCTPLEVVHGSTSLPMEGGADASKASASRSRSAAQN